MNNSLDPRLYKSHDSFLMILDSRKSTCCFNTTKNSQVCFQLTDPIYYEKNALSLVVNVESFNSVNPFYNITEDNNYLKIISANGDDAAITITPGRYSINELITELNKIELTIEYGIQYTFATSPYLTGIQITADNFTSTFSISISSTINPVIGFPLNYTNSSIIYNDQEPFTNILKSPFPCNLMGSTNMNISISNITTSNISSQFLSVSSVIGCIPIYNTAYIAWQNNSDFECNVSESYLDHINISLTDTLGNPLDFMNIPWVLVLRWTKLREGVDMRNSLLKQSFNDLTARR